MVPPATAGTPNIGRVGKDAISNRNPTIPVSEPGSASRAPPTSAIDAASPAAVTAPRWRTSVRLAMMPSGTTRGVARRVSMSSDGTPQAYDADREASGHDNRIAWMALVFILVARLGSGLDVPRLGKTFTFALSVLFVVSALRTTRWKGLVLVALSALMSITSSLASHGAAFTKPFAGFAVVRADSQWKSGTVRTTIEIEGKRFAVVAGGEPGRRLMAAGFGQTVWVEGRRSPRPITSFDLGRHVVGSFDPAFASTQVGEASPLHRSTNRARSLLARASDHTMWSTGGLYLGLVVGDDSRQGDELISAFRDAGLSHLTAVSGQNIALVLALLQPLLKRLGATSRTLAAVFLVGWFVVVTRAEPSVVRAAATAVITLVAAWRGRSASALRVLSVVTLGLLLIDPLLVWSVGFLLSVSATWGMIVLAPRFEAMLPGPRWLCTALATTAGAQLAVIPVSLGVFGRFSLIGLITNVPAVPLAGFVMIVGLPLGLAVGCADSVSEAVLGFGLDGLWQALMLPISLAIVALREIALVASLRN